MRKIRCVGTAEASRDRLLGGGARGEQLGQRVDGGFEFGGADDGAVLDRHAVWCNARPGGAVAVEDQVVLDGQFEPGLGEFILNGQHGGERASVGQGFQVHVVGGAETGFVERVDGVNECHVGSLGQEFVWPGRGAARVRRDESCHSSATKASRLNPRQQ